MNQSVIGATRIENIFEMKLRENFAAIVGKGAPKKVADVIRGMEEHFSKALAADLGQCNICEGWSAVVDGIDRCPYCDDQPVDAKEEVVKGEKMDIEETIVVQAEVLHERMDEIPIDATALLASGVELEEPKTSKRKKLTSGEVAEAKKVTKAPALPKASTAVVVGIAAGARIPRTEKDLEDSLARFRAAGTANAESFHTAGTELKKMRDELWQQRTEGEKPKYKSWNQFICEELFISKTLANGMIRVSDVFSIDQARKFGIQVLKSLASAPKEEHALLMSMASEGATTRQLEAEVKQIREKGGITVIQSETADPKRSSRTTAATAAAAQSRRSKEAAAITIGLKTDHAVIPLLCRGKDVRATKIEDQPYGVLECINGVTLYVAIRVTPTGDWEAKLTAKREKDDEEE